ncbi:hypothetical protein G6F31_017368 [Rhizopus arrhizus]|nr:hypothetical protein G6F31_017368 [Rhizopus arrhizus]
MLAASLRVGYVAANPDILQKLADLKMLAGLTSPELGERVVHRVLMEGQYRRHIERVRARVDDARQRCLKGLLKLGLTVPHEPNAGMFVWADCGRDTEVLARDLGPHGVRVNAVAPGWIASSGMDSYDDKYRAVLRKLKTKVPLQRFGTEAELAAAVVFLLAPAAAFINGSVIRVDGGVPNARHSWSLQPAERGEVYNGVPQYVPPSLVSDSADDSEA